MKSERKNDTQPKSEEKNDDKNSNHTYFMPLPSLYNAHPRQRASSGDTIGNEPRGTTDCANAFSLYGAIRLMDGNKRFDFARHCGKVLLKDI